MNKNLSILKIKPLNNIDDTRFNKLDENLLKPPFLMVINAPVKSGKSVLLQNLIYNDNFYKNIFDNVVYISPTIYNDATLCHMVEDDNIIKIEDPSQLEDIIDKVIESQKENPEEHTLLILDDCLGFIKRHSRITTLCTRYRHFRISIIITSQDFKSIPNIIRANASGYILFKTLNSKEYEKIESEFNSIPHFNDLYKYATEAQYNFLFINLRDLNIFHNFTKKIYDKHLNIKYIEN